MRTAPSRAGEAWQEGAAGLEGSTSTLGKTWPYQDGPWRGDSDGRWSAPVHGRHTVSHTPARCHGPFESDEHRRAGKQEDDMALFMDAHTSRVASRRVTWRRRTGPTSPPRAPSA